MRKMRIILNAMKNAGYAFIEPLAIYIYLLLLIVFNALLQSRFVDQRFVPHCSGFPSQSQLNALNEFINQCKRLLVLTGAGVSTESGIPDYRSPEVGLYARSNHRPLQYQDFIKSEHVRRRYWARNFTAWPIYSLVKPNDSHKILSKWEKEGRIYLLVTQNVDNLHRSAGSERLVEMHGNTHRVTCLDCQHHMSRQALQEFLKRDNPDWKITSDKLAPDGDIMLSNEDIQQFKLRPIKFNFCLCEPSISSAELETVNPEKVEYAVAVPDKDIVQFCQIPACPACKSEMLKPDIIFFGDNLPHSLRDKLTSSIHECDSILCLGTSLQTFSSFRLVNLAHQQKKPVVMINIGPSRADNILNLKIEGRISSVLSSVDN